MAQTIKLKRSATPGAIPSLESLELGEIAINTNDGKVYIKKDDGTSPDTIIEVTGAGGLASGDLNFLDNEKAIFGDGSDLQIYHDGISSYIKDSGTGRLTIQSASDFLVANTANTQNYIYAVESGAVNLYHSGSRKFETTATGIDVTGSVTATRLITSDGIGDAGSAGSESVFNSGQTTANFRVATTGSANTLFIDGGTNNVGIGTDSPPSTLTVLGPNDATGGITLTSTETDTSNKIGRIKNAHYTNAEEPFTFVQTRSELSDNVINLGGSSGVENAATRIGFWTTSNNTTLTGTEVMRINSAQNVGIGETSSMFADYKLQVRDDNNGDSKPLLISNKNFSVGTTQSVAINFGLSRDSGTHKPQAGRIRVGREGNTWDADDANIDSYMDFSVYESNALSTKLTIASDGNVGIGTNAPQTLLDVEGAANTELLRVGISANENSTLLISPFTAGATNGLQTITSGSQFGTLIQGGLNGKLVLATRDNDGSDSIDFVSGGGDWTADNIYDTTIATFRSDGVAIFPSGIVGIGTNAPVTPLHIYSSVGGGVTKDMLTLQTYRGDFGSGGSSLLFFNTDSNSSNKARIRTYTVDPGEEFETDLIFSVSDRSNSAITSISANTTDITVVHVASLGLGVEVGDKVAIQGTTNFNGSFIVTGVTNSTTFTIAATGYDAFATETSGNVAKGETFDRMVITGSGNVGIGTNSPNSRLHVVHPLSEYTTSLAETTTKSTLQLKTHAADSTITTFGGVSGGHAYIQRSNGPGTTPYSLLLNPYGGNVGIGTSSPIYDFQIGAYGTSADSTLALATSTSGTGAIRFGDGTSGTEANQGLIRYDHSDSSMVFWTSAEERMRIDSAGDATFSGDVTVTGDLFVTGATTSVNVEDLNVEQGEITLNFGAGDTSAAANGAGIRIQDAVDASTDATILWNATSDKFEFSHGIISAGPITGSNLSGTNTGDETQSSINALGITEVGTITSGIWNGSAIASAYLDADTAHLTTTQTFTGQKNFNSSGGTIPLNISRSGSNANQVLSIGVTDTTAEFNYIEDTDSEGTGAYGSYVFKVSGNEVTSPTTTVLTLDENQAKFAGTIYTRGATSLTPDATQPGAIILAKGGSEASPSTDGRGIEFLTADVNDGYGHRLVSFDNSNGDTPLILQRRNNNAAWTTQVTFEGNSNNTTFAGAISASNLSGTNTGDEPNASTTVKGIVELATTAETTTGTDATRAVTPDGLKDGYQGSTNVTTLGTIATGTWNGTAIASAYLDTDTAHLSGTQTFTGNKTFSGGLGISDSSPAFIINDSDASNATNQVGYISFQRGSAEKAWIGYGSSGNPDFTIRNTEGAVTIDSNVDVTGTLTATSKSFDIEHPTKEGMRLRYGSLEGPENGVYVRGRMDGEQVIELPDYWLGLVHEDTITVSLTAIGPGSVWVESIENNTITVGGSEKFFYHVFAERKDIEKLTVEYDV